MGFTVRLMLAAGGLAPQFLGTVEVGSSSGSWTLMSSSNEPW
jgi:hypothetical protein